MNYRIHQFARGRWEVIGPSGVPVYDSEPHGKDKPIIFDDVDMAIAFAERRNELQEGEE